MTSKKTGIIKRFKPFLKGFWLPTILTPLLIICEVVLEIFIPLLMAAIVDGGLYREENFILKEFFSPQLIANNQKFVLVLGGLMILAALLSLVFGMLAAATASVAGMGFAKNIRSAVFKRIQLFSFGNIDKFSTSSLVVRTTADVNNIQNTFQQIIRALVRSPIMIILAAVMAIKIDLELSFIFIFAIPILVAGLIILTRIGHPRFAIMMKKLDKMNSKVQENLIASRVVKSFVREDYEKKKFNDSADELRTAQIRAQKMFAFSNPIQLGVMWTCTVLLLLIGGRKVMFFHSLNVGNLVSMISYTTQVITSLAMVSFMLIGLSMTKASLQRVSEVLEEVPEQHDSENKLKVSDGTLDFNNVCFSYTNNPDNLTLKNIELHIKSGETIGIIGGTGDGKSTLVQLIPRFYDCMSGEIRIGGKPVSDYSLFELRESVAMVLQKNMLFSGTIAENLRWGDKNATDEEITAACKIACADKFVESFPDKYETLLGQGGVNVSGGQKQRLCIARALLKKPKILILDDSTSAVDTATDEKIRAALKTYLPGTTKIIIAQRIASVMDADKIVVMNQGTITDIGTNDELLLRSEIYREVYDSQMQEGKVNGKAI